MNKRTGIITFHRALSYGAMLQAYALQNSLFELGIDNEIIDYNCEYMVNHYQKAIRPIKGNPVKGIVWNLLTASGIKKECKTRTEFVNAHLKLSKPYTQKNISEAADEYGAIITGSDQVWSPTCVGFDPVYFLTFARPAQKFSYAASIASKAIPENLKEEFASRISDFSGYSLREQSGARLVKELVGKDALVNIDPTLLLTKEKWDKLAVNTIEEPYIFLFTVLKPRKLIDFAVKLGKKKKMKVIYLNKLQYKKYDGVEYMDSVTADKFVGLIKNASYVCTNSFHGTAFSVIYHKNFIVETETASSRNIRSEELLNTLKLDSRILSDNGCPDIDEQSDWDFVDKAIDGERQKSFSYLKQICKSDSKE